MCAADIIFGFNVIQVPFTLSMALDPSYGGWRTSFVLLRFLPSLATLETPDASSLHLMLTFASTCSGFGVLLVLPLTEFLLLVLTWFDVSFSCCFPVLLISLSLEHDDYARCLVSSPLDK